MPIFNSEIFLTRAIKSISLNTEDEKEIILVNDNSSDKSLNICKNLKKKYKNIILINNKKNLGPGKSRNIGLNKAKGKYIIFLDSDDYLNKNSLKNLRKKILKNKFPEVILNNVYREDRDKDNSTFLRYLKNKLYKQQDFVKILQKKNIIINECWNLIVKNENPLKKVRFLNTRIAEDNWYVINIINKMRNILVDKSNIFLNHSSNISSQKHLVGLASIIAYMTLSTKYREAQDNLDNNSIFKKYINYRLKVNNKYLKTYLYLLNEKEKKNLFNLKNSKIFLSLDFFHKKSKKKYYNFKRELNKFNIIYEKKLKYVKNLVKNHGYKINVFCADFIGKSAVKYFESNKVKINKIIDDDINLHKKYLMKNKIFLLKKIKKRDIKNSINLICHQNNKVFFLFRDRLKKLNIKKPYKVLPFQGI